MAFVRTFCVVFSLRLGVIIIAIITLIVSSIFLTVSLAALADIPAFSQNIQDVLHEVQFFQSFFENIHFIEELFYYVIGLTTFYVLMTLSCIFLLMAAYQCKPKFAYLFLFLYILHMVLLLLYMVILCLYAVDDERGLGTIILYFCIIYFILVFLCYTWICVYSLLQIIENLEKRLIHRIRLNFPHKHGIKRITRY